MNDLYHPMPLGGAGKPDYTAYAEAILRRGGLFAWSTVTLLALAVYVYTVEVERARWDIVLAGLAFWLMDWFNEIVNALFLHFNGHGALWTITGDTSFLILIGLPIEVSLFFAINGVVFAKLLPQDRAKRMLGLPTRWTLAIALSLVSVAVELLLHADGAFHWYYSWWNVATFPVIVVLGYLTFYIVSFWVFYLPDVRAQVKAVGALATLVAAMALVFGPVLNWI
jgi:hypothetical protein